MDVLSGTYILFIVEMDIDKNGMILIISCLLNFQLYRIYVINVITEFMVVQ